MSAMNSNDNVLCSNQTHKKTTDEQHEHTTEHTGLTEPMFVLGSLPIHGTRA